MFLLYDFGKDEKMWISLAVTFFVFILVSVLFVLYNRAQARYSIQDQNIQNQNTQDIETPLQDDVSGPIL